MARASAFALQVDVLKREIGRSHAQTMAAAARAAFADAQRQNRAELGREPAFEQIVDGRKGAALESVKPGGRIVFLFDVGAELLSDATDFAIAEFLRIAPVGKAPEDEHPGLYRKSLLLLVNGARRDASKGGVVRLKQDDIVALTNLVPYARKLNMPGFTAWVPNGVFNALRQRVAAKYGHLLNVRLSLDHYPGFAVGRTRRGDDISKIRDEGRRAKEQRRAASFPTLTITVK